MTSYQSKMRAILGSLLLLGSFSVLAAPFLYADPAPAGSGVDTARYTVNGGSPITCQLEPASGSVRPKCDLGQITTAGVYTLVVTWCTPGGIVNSPTGAVNTPPGCASSSPFAYDMRAPATVGPSNLRVAP